MKPRRANRHGGQASRLYQGQRRSGEQSRVLRLHPRQHDFVLGESKFSFYVGGIGAGKTYAGGVKALVKSQMEPASLGLIGAPTYPMLRDVTQRTFFELLPEALIRSWNKSEGHLTLVNGAEILFRSADQPDRYRGLNLAWYWLDEAPLCGHYAWQVLKGRLRQPGHQLQGWATGSPKGRDGYARDFEISPKPGHALYRASTRDNQANLPAGFIEDLGYTGVFAQQEVEGLFVAFEGLVYAFDGTLAAVGGHVRSAEGMAFRRVVGGIDWGYTNPAVALVVGLDGDQRAQVIEEFYERRASLTERVIPEVVALSRRHQVSVWHADAEDPEAIDQTNRALADAGLACRVRAVAKGPGSVRAGIQTVTGLLGRRGDDSRGLYVDPRCVQVIAEFGSYAYASESAKRDASESPVKQNDHALDALRYALHSELAGVARTEAYLAEVGRRIKVVEVDPNVFY